MDKIQKAKIFATAARAAVGQQRKYTLEPYIVHPAEVASMVAFISSPLSAGTTGAALHVDGGVVRSIV